MTARRWIAAAWLGGSHHRAVSVAFTLPVGQPFALAHGAAATWSSAARLARRRCSPA
jgi:hypothetical protein